MKEKLIQYFVPLYILNSLYDDGLENPEKYKDDKKFLAELQKFKDQDKNFMLEITKAVADTSGKYDAIWEKAEKIDKKPILALNGKKLSKIKELNSYRRPIKKERGGTIDHRDLNDYMHEGTIPSSVANK
jgi:hypothetical protein